ncbi:uncharacterized protein isoform X2 [Musca autumnalis]|uniref:uncharacterized protein isoform X2 n=1 Tax=Musca autumnalis TaxID=221902 RepID=UPI003CEA7678
MLLLVLLDIYQKYPNLQINPEVLMTFLNKMAFQRLQNSGGSSMRSFINYAYTLDNETQKVLFSDLQYGDLVNKIRSPCSDFFATCQWQDKTFTCCENFKDISSMLGKCFIMNSLQNYSETGSKLVTNNEIYSEPYRLSVTFKKPSKIFLLNNKDLPETITPRPRYSITEENLQLNLEFTIIPTINDKSLDGLDSTVTNCRNSNHAELYGNKTFLYHSYTACITDCLYVQQAKICGCINLYHFIPNVPFCNLTQYACLEEHGFINPVSMMPIKYPFCRHCITNCEDSDYVVENLYYNINASLRGKRSLELILLNFPTKHKRRQVIRQTEDKLVSLSGILCLCLGFNVVNIIEFLYLCGRAFVRQHQQQQ